LSPNFGEGIVIKDNIISLISVAIGAIALILQAFGMVQFQTVASITLALVALMATSEIVERNRYLAKLEIMLKDERETIANGLDKLLFSEIDADEAYEQMRSRIMSAKKSVLWASTGRRHDSSSDNKRPYESAIEHVAKGKRARITWISSFGGKARSERGRKLVFDCGDNPKLFVGYVPEQTLEFPNFSFIIFDETNMLTRLPFPKGGRARYLLIESPSVVKLYLDYFDRLLERSKKLDATDETNDFFDKMAGLDFHESSD
jgi:hypothetical protein